MVSTPAKPIAFVCGSRAWGGLELNVLRAANWFGDRGIEVHIFTDPAGPLYRRAQTSGLHCHPITTGSKLTALANGRAVAQACDQHAIATLVLHTRADMTAAILARKLSTNLTALVYYQHMQLAGSKRDLFHTWQYRRFNAWIAPLKIHARRLEELTRYPKERIHVIPFGIDIGRFGETLPSRSTARKQLDLPEEATMVGTVGRLDPKKGQDTLIEAVAALNLAGVEVHALLVGDRTRGEWEEFEERLHGLAAEHNLADRIHFRPHMEIVAPAFAAMDLFAMTSHSETYGLVTIEAMAAGLPVVGTSSGGTMEIVDSGETGLLVPPQDPAALAKAVQSLLADDELRQRLVSGGREKAIREYSHRTQIDRMLCLFDSLES